MKTFKKTDFNKTMVPAFLVDYANYTLKGISTFEHTSKYLEQARKHLEHTLTIRQRGMLTIDETVTAIKDTLSYITI